MTTVGPWFVVGIALGAACGGQTTSVDFDGGASTPASDAATSDAASGRDTGRANDASFPGVDSSPTVTCTPAGGGGSGGGDSCQILDSRRRAEARRIK